MTKDMPDYMRGFDHDDGDWGFTPVNKPPEDDKPGVDASVIENSNIEIAKVKSDVSSIKSMMNEIMQIVAEKDTVTKELTDEQTQAKFKDIEKLILPFLISSCSTSFKRNLISPFTLPNKSGCKFNIENINSSTKKLIFCLFKVTFELR